MLTRVRLLPDGRVMEILPDGRDVERQPQSNRALLDGTTEEDIARHIAEDEAEVARGCGGAIGTKLHPRQGTSRPRLNLLLTK